MCELSLANLNDPKLNKLYLYIQMHINSTGRHKDGYGVFNKEYGIFKSEKSFCESKEGVDFLQSINNPFVTLGHCRFATQITGKAKVIDKGNAHPFETEKLILAHNGVVEFRDPNKLKDYPDVTVDSLLFLYELDKLYDGKNFVEAFNQTAEKFYGAFVFIIFSKLENRWFIIRGEKRVFHYTFIYRNDVKIGLVGNTELIDLNRAVSSFLDFANLQAKAGDKYTRHKDSYIMASNSINTVGKNDLFVLGKTLEVEKPVAIFRNDNFVDNYRGNNKGFFPAVGHKKLLKFIDDAELDVFEVDQMCYSLFGKGVLEITSDEVKELSDFGETLRTLLSDKKKEIWREVCGLYYNNVTGVYVDYGIQLPYFMNSKKQLAELKEKVKKDMKND